MKIEFFIPFELQPKQGDRSRIVEGPGKRFVHHYQPSKVTKNAKSIASLVEPHRPAEPLKGPLRMNLVIQSVWRSSEPQKNRVQAKPKDTRPDWDNYGKQICDILQASGFYANDAQLADVRIRKLWTDSPGVQVMIEEMS